MSSRNAVTRIISAARWPRCHWAFFSFSVLAVADDSRAISLLQTQNAVLCSSFLALVRVLRFARLDSVIGARNPWFWSDKPLDRWSGISLTHNSFFLRRRYFERYVGCSRHGKSFAAGPKTNSLWRNRGALSLSLSRSETPAHR